jgi:hypothetical protein
MLATGRGIVKLRRRAENCFKSALGSGLHQNPLFCTDGSRLSPHQKEKHPIHLYDNPTHVDLIEALEP